MGALGGLDVAVDIDVMDVRFHEAFSCAAIRSECGRDREVAWG